MIYEGKSRWHLFANDVGGEREKESNSISVIGIIGPPTIFSALRGDTFSLPTTHFVSTFYPVLSRGMEKRGGEGRGRLSFVPHANLLPSSCLLHSDNYPTPNT